MRLRGKPRILDLFCGAGGAARGYARAGFDVVGVDHVKQPNYPFEFHQADVLDFLAGVIDYMDVEGARRQPFVAIHSSPPCQFYANVTAWRGRQEDHDDLVPETRRLLRRTGLPWVIENVREAGLENPSVLCGSQFGLRVKRHRYFETNWMSFQLGLSCSHVRLLPFMHKGERAYADAMGCDWMTNREARQAIPPAYTEFIGQQLIQHLQDREQETGWSRGEHEAEGRAVEAHQEAKHGDW